MTKANLSVVSANQITVERGIPMATKVGDATRKYPFNTMEVGDSFALGNLSRDTVSNAAYAYGKINSNKFSVRKLPDGTHRCWRLA